MRNSLAPHYRLHILGDSVFIKNHRRQLFFILINYFQVPIIQGSTPGWPKLLYQGIGQP